MKGASPGLVFVWLAAGTGCADGDDDSGGPTCPTELTWSNFGDGFFTTWCTGCHSSELPPEDRGNAPVNVNFDTYAGVLAYGDKIADRTYGKRGGMPPAGPADDLDLLEEWIVCGMPGEPTTPPPPAPCDAPVEVTGDVAASAGSPCAGQDISIDGNLILDGDTDLSCVCAVTGSVLLAPGATNVSLPALRTVEGALTSALSADDLVTLSFPSLSAVSGPVTLQGLGHVTSFGLPSLVSVGGDFVVTGSDVLVTFDLPRLETVGGSLAIVDLPELVDVTNFTGVTGDIPGSITIADVPKYRGPFFGGWSALVRVESVGGSITIRHTGFREIAAFQETTSVGGAVVISENPFLESVTGFFELASVGTRIEVADNPSLTELVGFLGLVSVGATADYPDAGIFLVDLPSLVELDSFGLLMDVDAFALVDCDALSELSGFDDSRLRELPGGLRIIGNDNLGRVDAFANVANTGDLTLMGSGLAAVVGFGAIERVEGDVSIDANPDLTSLAGFQTIQSVSGSVYVRDNPTLATADAETFAYGIPSVGGAVVVTGNGP